ncbi:MAG TPA: cation:proton antiporter [Thermoprotei archaeon]|nr:cation:proton antiporter [Thermoprotei archaeon]
MIEYSLLITSAVLVGIGVYMASTKKNLLKIFIGIEILATGVNLNFIGLAFIKYGGLSDALANSIVITSIVIDGVLVGVGLALTILVYRRYNTLNVDILRKLRW